MEVIQNFYIYPNGKIYGRKRQIYMPEKIDSKGFHYVKIGSKIFYPHLLVAKHFKINFHNYPTIRHRDGNKSNNQLENIEYTLGSRYDERVKRNRNICYVKQRNYYRISVTRYNIEIKRSVKKQKTTRYFIDALCYKFIFILKMRSGLV